MKKDTVSRSQPVVSSNGHPEAAPSGGWRDDHPEVLAQRFHEAYERLAPYYGYETRTESAKPWSEVPDRNKRLMIAVCAEITACDLPHGGWRPIESAPKDGTAILACWLLVDRPPLYGVVSWGLSEEDGAGSEPSWLEYQSAVAGVTHWMPLPPPPGADALSDEELRAALHRPGTLAQIPALIMANIEDVPDWRNSVALITAHCHARVLHEDLAPETQASVTGPKGRTGSEANGEAPGDGNV